MTARLWLTQLRFVCYACSVDVAPSDSGGGSSSMEPRNKALPKEFEPEFNHLGKLEHPTLLCWQSLGLRPYQDDPLATSQAGSGEENTLQLSVTDNAPPVTSTLLENLRPIKGGRRVSVGNIVIHHHQRQPS